MLHPVVTQLKQPDDVYIVSMVPYECFVYFQVRLCPLYFGH